MSGARVAILWAAAVPAFAAPLIAIDVGQYPDKPGVIAASGTPELQYNLALAADVKAALEQAEFAVRLLALYEALPRLGRVAQGAALSVAVHPGSVRQWPPP